MKRLLLSRNDKLAVIDRPDVRDWFSIYGMLNPNVVLIDRCDLIRMPFAYKNAFPMVRDLSGFNKTYAEVAIERAQDLVAQARRVDRPLLLLYSGGIDSTAMVISFIMALGADTRDITIAMNATSLRENPKFYKDHIRGRFQLLGSETALDLLDGSYLVVGGEFNDQIFGSDVYRQIINWAGMRMLYEPASERNVTAFFEHLGMTPHQAWVWYSLIRDQAQQANLVDLPLIKDFFWWINFSLKWQSVYFRMIARAQEPSEIDQEFLDRYYRQFYQADDFQRWSMLNPHKKIGQDWPSYKLEAKKFIYDFTRDRDYHDNKTKFGSLSGVFRQRRVPDAIDEDFQHVSLDHPATFYLPDNSFSGY